METVLRESLQRWGGAPSSLAPIEARMADPEVRQDAERANQHRPRLVDEHTVEFDPSWHRLLAEAKRFGLHAAAWTSEAPAPHLTRAAGFYLWSQLEAGHGCPISMTYASVPALRKQPDLAATWVPRLAGNALAGMTMTERQGGSDLRAIRTTATRRSDGRYLVDGEKWFCSAPMSDAFLVLAGTAAGPTCFLVPRQPKMRLVRLKDKLGNNSNASAQVAFDGAEADLVGEEGRGLPTILEAVAATRLDCVLGSAALQRRALTEAISHATERYAFGAPLIRQPLMRSVLADLVLDQQAATLLGMRLAAAVDGAEHDLLRLALPTAKYLVCKRTPGFVAEALECLGGNGYVEDETVLPLLFRESPLNSIWEGSGSIQALDVVRALHRSPAALEAWLTEVGQASGVDPAFDRAIEAFLQSLSDIDGEPDRVAARARALAERMACLLQAALLLRYAPAELASAFTASRLSGAGGLSYGVLPTGCDVAAILEHSLV